MALALGCGGRAWVGHYEGNRNLAVPEGANRALVRTLGMVKLELKGDGTFVLIEAGNPKTGDYTTAGDEATLRVKTFMDRPIAALGSSAEAMNQPIKLRRRGSESFELVDPTGLDGSPIVLRKAVGP